MTDAFQSEAWWEKLPPDKPVHIFAMAAEGMSGVPKLTEFIGQAEKQVSGLVPDSLVPVTSAESVGAVVRADFCRILAKSGLVKSIEDAEDEKNNFYALS